MENGTLIDQNLTSEMTGIFDEEGKIILRDKYHKEQCDPWNNPKNGWFLYKMQHWAEMFNQPLHSTVVQNEHQPFMQKKEDQLFSSMEKSFPKFLKLWNEDMKIITDLFIITKGTFKEKPVFFSKF